MLSPSSRSLVPLTRNNIGMTTHDLITTILAWLILGHGPGHNTGYVEHSFEQCSMCGNSNPFAIHAKALASNVIPPAPRKSARFSETTSNLISSTLWSSAGIASMRIFSGPAELRQNIEPWTKLQFQELGSTLTITNPTDYPVRMAPFIVLLPSRRIVVLPKPYINAGESMRLKNTTAGLRTELVLIQPETRKGPPHAQYAMPVKHTDLD